MSNIETDVRAARVLARGEGRTLAAGQPETVVKVESVETGGAFALIESSLDAKTWKGPEPHIHHAGSETFYVLEGAMEFVLGEERITASAGTCVHVPVGAVHSFSNPGPGRVRYSEILCPGSLLGMVEEIEDLLQAGVTDQEQFTAVFRRHDSEAVSKS